jgi:hypothetical protein
MERKNQRIKEAVEFREQTRAMELLLDATWNGSMFVKINPQWPINQGLRYTYYDRVGNRIPNQQVPNAPPSAVPDVRVGNRRGKSSLKDYMLELGHGGYLPR